jgi:2-oxoglutarate/2-oxoacid ferredoxin oxidoreductase subunit alpha
MAAVSAKPLVPLHQITIRFAGDSGDGMQLVGTQFADLSSLMGNSLCTMSDYPSEIRAPAGSLGGVSGFQLTLADRTVRTPGDSAQVLVAMNPAALKVSLSHLDPSGIIVANEDEFTEQNLKKAGYAQNPLTDDSLREYRLIPVAITRLNMETLKHLEMQKSARDRCKNFVALGLVMWLFDRPLQPLLEWMMKKFRKQPEVMAANGAALRAGHNYANTAELFSVHYHIAPTQLAKGRYRRVTGNEALALGCAAAAQKAGRPLVYASYPITPASEILHELSRLKRFDVRTLQLEDEIAACCAAVGASFGGSIGVTGTSGPGFSLKAEAMGLAVIAELPLVVINVQRAGPSTGMPTKSEQADLLQAVFGRHGESPAVVMAAASPSDCFEVAYEAVRVAVRYMTPVIVLSDGFLANCAEPWRLPDEKDLPAVDSIVPPLPEDFRPYERDAKTLARPWVRPGTASYEHRVGGLEKEDVTGAVSYDAQNHQRMVRLRAAKVERIAKDLPPAKPNGPSTGDLIVVSWGSTYGPCSSAVEELQADGLSVAHLHLRYLNPLPKNLRFLLREYRHVLVPENNEGHLRFLLRNACLVDAQGLNKVEGRPFLIREIKTAIRNLLRRGS